ncbi:MAG: class I SAM-dependent methyltransferase, partial [Burkholderiales bacterium]
MAQRLDLVRLEPRSVLDVGCGAGAGMAVLARRYPSAWVVGVDLSARMAGEAGRRFGQAPGSGIGARLRSMLGGLGASLAERGPRVVRADAQALPLADAGFDLVWSNLALHWFADPVAAIAEWRRVLRPGGL